MDLSAKSRERIGIALIVVSYASYALFLLVPFLPYGPHGKATAVIAIIAAGEGAFWIGALLAGKEFMIYLRKKLWPANWKKPRPAARV